MAIAVAAMTEAEAGAAAACAAILDRLNAVVREETDVLGAREAGFHGQFAERKNQLLRELLIAQRACTSQAARQALAERTKSLQALLTRNRGLLKLHMDAVREVSAIIVDAIRQSESDGTYSRQRA